MYKACKEILDKLENRGVSVNHGFKFPPRIPLTKRLKDVLEDDVDEKYYLSDEQVGGLIKSNYDQNKRFYDPIGLSPTLSTMGGGQREPKKIEPSSTRGSNVASTIRATIYKQGKRNLIENIKNGNGYEGVVVPIRTANTKGYDLATDGDGIDLGYPDSKTRRGRVGHGVCKTLPTSDSQGVLDGFRIRKLTPRECYRLMGFDDASFDRASRVISNTQLYKTAGNSIVVPVLEAILKELLCN